MNILKIINKFFDYVDSLYIHQRYYYSDGREVITMGQQLFNEANNNIMLEQQTETALVAKESYPEVYYAFSRNIKPTVTIVVKDGKADYYQQLHERASIALSYDGKQIKYGISICSPEDNFDRTEGKKRAKDRLDANYACIDFPIAVATITAESATDYEELKHKTAIKFLRSLVNAIDKDMAKFKGRLIEFNAANPQFKEPTEGSKRQKKKGYSRVKRGTFEIPVPVNMNNALNMLEGVNQMISKLGIK